MDVDLSPPDVNLSRPDVDQRRQKRPGSRSFRAFLIADASRLTSRAARTAAAVADLPPPPARTRSAAPLPWSAAARSLPARQGPSRLPDTGTYPYPPESGGR